MVFSALSAFKERLFQNGIVPAGGKRKREPESAETPSTDPGEHNFVDPLSASSKRRLVLSVQQQRLRNYHQWAESLSKGDRYSGGLNTSTLFTSTTPFRKSYETSTHYNIPCRQYPVRTKAQQRLSRTETPYKAIFSSPQRTPVRGFQFEAAKGVPDQLASLRKPQLTPTIQRSSYSQASILNSPRLYGEQGAHTEDASSPGPAHSLGSAFGSRSTSLSALKGAIPGYNDGFVHTPMRSTYPVSFKSPATRPPLGGESNGEEEEVRIVGEREGHLSSSQRPSPISKQDRFAAADRFPAAASFTRAAPDAASTRSPPASGTSHSQRKQLSPQDLDIQPIIDKGKSALEAAAGTHREAPAGADMTPSLRSSLLDSPPARAGGAEQQQDHRTPSAAAQGSLDDFADAAASPAPSAMLLQLRQKAEQAENAANRKFLNSKLVEQRAALEASGKHSAVAEAQNHMRDLEIEHYTKQMEALHLRRQFLHQKEEAEDPARAPLSEEQEALVDDAFHGDMRQIIASSNFSNIELTRSKVLCMRNGEWLNDEVINFQMGLLQERELRAHNPPRVHFCNTFFYNALFADKHTFDYNKVRRWTTELRLKRYKSILDCEKIVVPVHQGNHWVLGVIDIKNKKLVYMDSLFGQDSTCTRNLAEYIACEYENKRKEEVDVSTWEHCFPKKIPKQGNCSDCGVFMLKFADYVSRDADLSFTQEDMPYFRRRIVAELRENHME